MAIKDWKKYGNESDKWYNKKIKVGIDYWNPHKSFKEIKSQWIVKITEYTNVAGTNVDVSRQKSFKTKSQALKFAKAYMKKH
jgi:hypothetical protein